MKQEAETAWASYRTIWNGDEDVLIGNRCGLSRLCDSIQEAIRTGSSETTDPGVRIERVCVVEVDPIAQQRSLPRRIAKFTAYAFGPPLLTVIFALGCRDLWRLLEEAWSLLR